MATAGRTSPAKKRSSPPSKASATKTPLKPKAAKASAAANPDKKAQAARVLRRLKADYPTATCALENETPFELLVATILSAQCTDERVNMVTPALFKRYPSPAAMAAADPPELEKLIHTTGFFRQKAKSLRGVAAAIAREFDGELPRDLDTLITLPGIGRKTANVVLGTAYGVPSIMVDTHVRRLSYRLGFTVEDDPVKIEMDLRDLLPPSSWTAFSHRLIHHGRRICLARKPRCLECPLARWCPRIGVTTVAKSPT
jgi:endonuclease-3